jgi:hypothetical protein
MFTNEIKKGMRIKLVCGWEADMLDNKKGNVRLAYVYGYEHEAGSVYSHDIVYCKPTQDGDWIKIKHTAAQIKLSKLCDTPLVKEV